MTTLGLLPWPKKNSLSHKENIIHMVYYEFYLSGVPLGPFPRLLQDQPYLRAIITWNSELQTMKASGPPTVLLISARSWEFRNFPVLLSFPPHPYLLQGRNWATKSLLWEPKSRQSWTIKQTPTFRVDKMWSLASPVQKGNSVRFGGQCYLEEMTDKSPRRTIKCTV